MTDLYKLQDKATNSMSRINQELNKTPDKYINLEKDWNIIHKANVDIFKAWHNLSDIVILNEENDKKLRLLNKRVFQFSDMIMDNVQDIETQKFLLDNMGELFLSVFKEK